MFNRPKVLSPRRAPFSDLQNLPNREEEDEGENHVTSVDAFDWNRRPKVKKPAKRVQRSVALRGEEKEDAENRSPNSKMAFEAFGKKKSPSSRSSMRQTLGRREDSSSNGFTASLEEDSPRQETKDVHHENLLRIAHEQNEKAQSPSSVKTPTSMKGPPAELVSPPSHIKAKDVVGLVGSPMLNVVKREVEWSPPTPDLSVSPSQQKTPPTMLVARKDCDLSPECEDANTGVDVKGEYEYDCKHYGEYDFEDYNEKEAYYGNDVNPAYYEEEAEADAKALYEYKKDTKSGFDESRYSASNLDHEEVCSSATLQALTPVKLKYSVTVDTELEAFNENNDHKIEATYSPESTSSSLTNPSYYTDIEQFFSKVRHNRIDEVRRLLDTGTSVRVKDSNGNSLLHICAQNNLRKMASIILEHGADINAENKKGYTALDYCDNYQFDKLGDWFVKNGGDNSHKQLGL